MLVKVHLVTSRRFCRDHAVLHSHVLAFEDESRRAELCSVRVSARALLLELTRRRKWLNDRSQPFAIAQKPLACEDDYVRYKRACGACVRYMVRLRGAAPRRAC